MCTLECVFRKESRGFKRKVVGGKKSKIDRINSKIEIALSKTQQVTPSFINQLIGLYERKNTTQKDKVYILLELKNITAKNNTIFLQAQ